MSEQNRDTVGAIRSQNRDSEGLSSHIPAGSTPQPLEVLSEARRRNADRQTPEEQASLVTAIKVLEHILGRIEVTGYSFVAIAELGLTPPPKPPKTEAPRIYLEDIPATEAILYKKSREVQSAGVQLSGEAKLGLEELVRALEIEREELEQKYDILLGSISRQEFIKRYGSIAFKKLIQSLDSDEHSRKKKRKLF